VLETLGDLPVRPVATERSSGARRSLASIEGVTVLDHLPPSGSGIVVAHELLDNLAIRRMRGTDEGPREVRITVVDDELHEVLTPLDDLAAPGSLPPGEESIVPVGATAFALEALRVPEPRALLAIDYGSERAGGEVHGYRDHRVVEDVLRNPGGTDITAGVDFGALRHALEAEGLQVFDPVTQRQALTALGFEPWFLTQLERQRDLLNTGRGTEAVRAWGDRSRSTLLVDPGGLGRFRWFLASNVPMPEPPWMSEARTIPD
jgi:SAM-dependent MidA family methyltransferase